MLILALVMGAFVLCAPALAQGGPAAQYPGASGDCPSETLNVTCSQSVAGGVEDFTENAGQGTEAVGKAMDEPEGSVAADSVDTPEEAAADGDRGGPDSITELPETGGASPTALVFGVSLVSIGLMVRRLC